MKKTEMTTARAISLVAEMFANGKNPMESFGIRWEEAENLEDSRPDIVSRVDDSNSKQYACC